MMLYVLFQWRIQRDFKREECDTSLYLFRPGSGGGGSQWNPCRQYNVYQRPTFIRYTHSKLKLNMASVRVYLLCGLSLCYLKAVTGQNGCNENQFACWGLDSFCIPSGYRCDGDPDCSDGSDERGCGDIIRVCHCLNKNECRSTGSCDYSGCQDGWEGYKCAFKVKNRSISYSPVLTTTTSHSATSCHCEDQSLCEDFLQSRSCFCQEGWKGYRCSEKLEFSVSESLPMVGSALVIFLAISVCVTIASCYRRMHVMRRGHVDDGWPYRGLTNSGNSQENVGTSFRSQRLSLAPPSYDDVIIQGRERNSRHTLISMPQGNASEPPPPSYESIIKEQREQQISHLPGQQGQGQINNRQPEPESQSTEQAVQNQSQPVEPAVQTQSQPVEPAVQTQSQPVEPAVQSQPVELVVS
ncbi:low-density lipoprotein receptor class A domain-containing protein 3-like isoform X2 [Ostrea edulis]|uniref:low-density lipoprotein receptor class A domain-containing protein 3-like isoform X2 n=1 Tax=Ostrea edulis TaxID=37623 RepID=UPI0024AFBE3B|nr:low-density lipoprotein receptor class A domain-containing protein 3-like isoform X2 [Ostrea edulis]